MFETHTGALSVSSELPDEKLLEIDYVSQRLQAAWFYITQHYMRSGSSDVSKGEVLIDDVGKLKRFLSKIYRLIHLQNCIGHSSGYEWD